MLKGKELGDAIRVALKQNEKTPADAARHFGVKPPSVSGWMSTGRITKDNFNELVAWLNLTPFSHWGLNDPIEGRNTHLSTVQDKNPLVERRKSGGPINLIDNPDYPAIRRVNIKLSAGASGFGVDYVDDDEAPIVFQRKWFEHHGYTPDKLLAVRVCNGSMEPGLYDGDTVIINTADTALKDGVVFSMNYEGELVVKRLVRDAGEWWLASDNPDQRRYPRKVCTEDVFCIGRIVHRQSERI